MVLNRARCCVAVPLYNVGIYAILCQFAVIALVTGVLSFAAPYIVAVAIPSFGSYILGAACMILFAIQGWGFFGVFKEKPLSYRKYVIANSILLGLAFLLSLVWIILSAARHSEATSRCVQQFVTSTDSSTTASSDGSLIKIEDDSVNGYTLCSIFTWVQLGIMGGLWLALFLLQVYFAIITRVYGVEQREDHKRYESIFVEQRDSYIRQSMMWENGRASLDGPPPNLTQTHGRTYSTVSRSSGLRNEMKYEEAGNDSNVDRSFSSVHFDDMPGTAGYQDSPMHASSPVKAAFTPGHGYSSSRSKLAPEHSHAALQQSQPSPYIYTNANANVPAPRPHSQHMETLQQQPLHQHQLSAASADSNNRKSYRQSAFLDDYYQ